MSKNNKQILTVHKLNNGDFERNIDPDNGDFERNIDPDNNDHNKVIYLTDVKNIKTRNNGGHIKSRNIIAETQEEKEKRKNRKRICVETEKWKKTVPGTILSSSVLQLDELMDMSGNIALIMKQQIMRKICGYKSQDQEKGLYDKEQFIDFNNVRETIIKENMLCYYCHKPVYILYEIVREKKQWSIDRIDNAKGHNNDNFVIACLECNLHRRCRKADEFLFTSELKVYKEPTPPP